MTGPANMPPAEAPERGFRVTGRLVLFTVLGFFAVIIGVNVTFVAFATQSFPGLVTDEPFKRGLAKNVNADLDARGALDARGWSVSLYPAYNAGDDGYVRRDAGWSRRDEAESWREQSDREGRVENCEELRDAARDEAWRRGQDWDEADERFYNNLCAQESHAQDRYRDSGRRARAGGLDLEVEVRDQNGLPVSGLALSGRLQRLVTDAGDVDLAFTSVGQGRYAARDLRAADGDWLVVLRGTFPDTGAPFIAETRLNLQ